MGTSIPNIGSSAVGDPIGKAVVEIIADDKAYQQGLKKGEKSLDLFDKKTQKIARKAGLAFLAGGTAIAAALSGVVFQAARAGDELDKMSLRTGETVENLSRLGFAADISGTSLQAVEMGIRRLTRNMNDFKDGTGEAAEAFERLGIDVMAPTGELRTSLDVITEVADKINALGSEAEKTALAQELFGRSGANLLPLLKQGSAGIQELMDRADELGVVMSTKAASASAEFTDKMTELTTSLKMAGVELGQALLPAAQKIVEEFTKLISKFNKLDATTQKYIGTSAAAAAGASILGGGLLLLASRIPALITGLTAFRVILAGLPVLLARGAAGFALLGASAFAYHQISNALKDTGANTLTNSLENLNAVLLKNEKDINEVTRGLRDWKELGGDPANATIAELQLNYDELSNAMRSNSIMNTNAADLLLILQERYAKNSKGVENLQDHIKLYGDAVDKANTEMAESLGVFDRYTELIDSGKTSTEALRIAMKELADATGGAADEFERVNGAALGFLDVADRLPTILERTQGAIERMNAAIKNMKLITPERESAFDPIVAAAEKARADLDVIEIELPGIPAPPIPDPKDFKQDVDRMKGWALDNNSEIAADQAQWRKDRAREDKEAQRDREKDLNAALEREKQALERSLEGWKRFTGDVRSSFSDMFEDMLDPSVLNKWDNFWRSLTGAARRYISELLTSSLFDQFIGVTQGQFQFGQRAGISGAGGQIPAPQAFTGAGRGGGLPQGVGPVGPVPKVGADPIVAFLASLEFAGKAKDIIFAEGRVPATGDPILDATIKKAIQDLRFAFPDENALQSQLLFQSRSQQLANLILADYQEWVSGPAGHLPYKPPDKFGIFGLAQGGIVNKPTLAIIGESGREAVIPLPNGGFPGGDTYIRIEQLDINMPPTIQDMSRAELDKQTTRQIDSITRAFDRNPRARQSMLR